MKKGVTRLYESFKPSNYALEITLDPIGMSFKGKVVITGHKTGRPSRRITLHQKGLKITSASLHRHDKNTVEEKPLDRFNTHNKYDELRLHSPGMLYPGKYMVTVQFQGLITEHMQGLYPCFFEEGGKKQMLLATQFESHHAREVFPCVDEPEAKATFDLTLITPEGDTVISNMPELSSATNKGRKTTLFATTPIMSTYLLAFISGNMHYVEAETKHGVTVRSWSSVAQPKKSLKYSADEAVRVLEFFADYFQVPYPLPKLDQVALPDFDAGAMENWGLVTYREIALLTDPDNRSVSSEQYVSLVVAHELSHQWFGNLVTMKWWDDLWLNESFASLMEHIALDAIHPDWQQWEMYTSSDVISTSSRDIYSDIQPVSVKVTDPELIESLFDPGIVYAKGGRLLKMLRDYIGDDDFRKGLMAYFIGHAYKNASRDDLWKALGMASHHDLVGLMKPWIEQSGMPVISVSQTGKRLALTQERFLLDEKPDPTLWPVPLLADRPVSLDLFNTKEAAVELEDESYVLLNRYASGHYFVRYKQTEHRDYLNHAVETLAIPTEARINILNDMYLLARRGDAPLTEALDMVIRCDREPRDSVWLMISRTIAAASQLTEGDQTCEESLKKLRIKLASDWYEKLGWDDKTDDDTNTKQLRHTVLALTLAGEHQGAISEALERYKKTDNLQDLPAETRSSILAAAVRHGEKEVIDNLMSLYPDAYPDLQPDITSALSATKDPASAKRILSSALGHKGFVRSQDVLRWIVLFLRNRHIRGVTWQFMEDNWKWLESVLSKSKSFDFLPTYCASIITTEEWAKKYREFFEPLKSRKSLERNILVGLADIEARVAWRKRDEEKIVKWLRLI